VLHSALLAARLAGDGTVEVEVGGRDPLAVRARLLVNCAGLDASGVAASIAGFPLSRVPQAWLAKGSYFTLAGRSPFSRLVYPVPEPGGLGVHLTLDLAGEARFGPDVEWVTAIDYRVDPRRADAFYGAIRRYWPALPDGALRPAYAGIRPKIAGPGMPAADFVIEGPREHGVPGVVNLFGIESPGLTAALAIADEVVHRARMR
jgi:L-2-hydroxyglutarate oxidase LhgO